MTFQTGIEIEEEVSLLGTCNCYYYKDLDDAAKMAIYHLQIVGDVAYEYTESAHIELIPDEDKIAWFEMINYAGTPPDAKHLQWLKEKV